MENHYGSDYITISAEDGTEFELEILSTIEYNGASYLAVIPADSETSLDVAIVKSVEEDGEEILCVVEDAQELQTVNELLMESLYEDEDTQ